MSSASGLKSSTATDSPIANEIDRHCQTLLATLQNGRWTELKNECLKLIPQFPQESRLSLYLGVAYKMLGEHNQAISALGKALELNPAEWQALYHLGHLMMDHQHDEQAIGLFESVLTHSPGHIPSLNQLYVLHMKRRDVSKALTISLLAVRELPAHPEQWLMVRRAMEQVDNYTLPPGFAEFVLEHAQQMSRRDTGLSMVAALLVFYTNPTFSNRSMQVRDQGISGLRSLSAQADFLSGFHDPLFLALLDRTIVGSMGFEQFIAAIRYAILSQLHQDAPSLIIEEKDLILLEKLAEYVFRSEYLPNVTEEETQWLEALASLLNQECGGPAADSLINSARLLTFLMYEPAMKLESIASWYQVYHAKKGSSPAKLLKLTYEDFVEEAEIAQSIECVGGIKDDISRRVQDQYEENPYPRWDEFSPLIACHAPDILKQIMPYIPPININIPKQPEVLIAGCGTGKHSLLIASMLPEARMTSVDLSRASLSYAIRKAKELGMEKNHRFLQGDILELKSLGQSYDIIESVGVLHHMKDPMAGWRVLTNILRPGGLMRIGLYSRSARRDIIRAREEISAGGYGEDIHGIRAYREKIGMDPRYPFNASSDFFTASCVRDLLFHRQEQQFTLPQIKQALQELGLVFLGFGNNQTIYERYQKHFPFNQDYMNLDNWQVVEENEPYTFFGMYQFWCYKPA
jgi:SAM-dependent methyltransferase